MNMMKPLETRVSKRLDNINFYQSALIKNSGQFCLVWFYVYGERNKRFSWFKCTSPQISVKIFPHLISDSGASFSDLLTNYLAMGTEYKASTAELGCHMILTQQHRRSNKCQKHMPPKLEPQTGWSLPSEI